MTFYFLLKLIFFKKLSIFIQNSIDTTSRKPEYSILPEFVLYQDWLPVGLFQVRPDIVTFERFAPIVEFAVMNT